MDSEKGGTDNVVFVLEETTPIDTNPFKRKSLFDR